MKTNSFNLSMFREYDIRGRENEEELSVESMELIGKAYGTFLHKKGISDVVIGYDNRKTSEEFQKSAIKGLISTGCRIIDIGKVITPMLYWSQYYFKSKGGMMITASHNPVGWNGVKLALGYSYTLMGAEIKEIYKIIISEKFAEGNGKIIKKENIFNPYLKDIVKRVKIQKPLKIVVNTGNGTAGLFVPDIFKAAGCRVVEQLTELDQNYPRYTPNPANMEMMNDTAQKVLEEKADIGFAYDGDGDRIGMVDQKGKIVSPNSYLIMLSRSILDKNPGSKIIFDVKSSQALEEDIKNNGGVPIMWKTGHSYIKKKLHEEKAALAGEMSGHVFFKDGYYGFDDAVFASLKLAEIASKYDDFAEYIDSLPRYFASPNIFINSEDEKKFKIIENLQKYLKKNNYEFIDIDGARINFSRGWALARASNTEPKIKCCFEGKTENDLKEIEIKALKIFKKVGIPITEKTYKELGL